MSFTTAPNWNTFIDRLALTLQNSTLLMPATNGDDTQKDLVRQIVKYTFPIPEQVPEGFGPPHIFINRAENPVIRRQKIGRDSRDEHGPEKWTLEFYAVSVIMDETENPLKSQEQLYNVTEAIMTTLGKNRRLLDDVGANPIAYTLTTLDVPYNIRSTSTALKAHNVIIRPEIIVNLRS